MLKSFDAYKHIQVSGEDIHSVISSITATTLCNLLLKKYGLSGVEKGKMYPLDNYLHLLADIEERMPTMLNRIGRAIIEEALFPPDVTSFEQALQVSDVGYYMNHHGAEPGEIGHYRFEKISDKRFHMIVDAPYPCIFDQGVIQGIADKYNTRINLNHADGDCRAKGADRCDYQIDIFR